MWFRNPIPKDVREILDALKNPPRGARKLGGPEALCRAFAALVDHTLLKPEATPEDVHRLCGEGVRHGFAAVVVNPCYVALAAECIGRAEVRVASVAGFPLGAGHPEVKLREAERALADGAREVDMVIHVGALKTGDNQTVEAEIRALAEVCHRRRRALLKVILECALLNDDEKRRGARLAVRAGADFVKTSTGFGPAGATVEDVALLRHAVGGEAGVKAAGGIRTLATAAQMLAAGASRIGTSSGIVILEELRRLARPV